MPKTEEKHEGGFLATDIDGNVYEVQIWKTYQTVRTASGTSRVETGTSLKTPAGYIVNKIAEGIYDWPTDDGGKIRVTSDDPVAF
jgi:hypothetical protein